MERWVRTESGFWAQGAVEQKNPNGNPDVTDWFRLEGRGFGNFTWERIGNVVKTPFKTLGQGPIFQLPVSSPTPASVGTDTQETPEVSGSIRSADKGMETTLLAPQVTRSAIKQTPRSSPRPKRAYVSPSKGSSSKRRR